MEQYKVTLERNGKTIYIILRGSDYAQSMRLNKDGRRTFRYGTGKVWNVVSIVRP